MVVVFVERKLSHEKAMEKSKMPFDELRCGRSFTVVFPTVLACFGVLCLRTKCLPRFLAAWKENREALRFRVLRTLECFYRASARKNAGGGTHQGGELGGRGGGGGEETG
jgi:hypothetical protein